MSARTRIVLGTLCTFNALLLGAIGLIAFFYVDGLAGPIGATLLWASAGALLVFARRLRKESDW